MMIAWLLDLVFYLDFGTGTVFLLQLLDFLLKTTFLTNFSLFHNRVATTLGGLIPGVLATAGVDGDGGVLPPLVDGDLHAPVSPTGFSSSWP